MTTPFRAELAESARRWLAEPTADDVLTAIAVGALTVAVWAVVLAFAAHGRLLVVPLIAHVAGMLAGYGVLVLLALMSRAPALERGVGADTLARWHGRGGRIVLTLVLVHAWAAVASWAQMRTEGWFRGLWQVVRLPNLMAATVGTVLLVAVAVASVRAARRRLTYETWHTLHLATYLAVALSFLHQLAGPDMAGHRVVQIGWALLYTHVFALVLRHRVFAPLHQAARHHLRVVEVVPEGPGIVSLVVAGRHLDELGAKPGQFLRWRFLTPHTWKTAHPFSLSAPPTATRLRLTVKALGDGSAHLQDIDVGTWVVAEGPYGSMTAERRTRPGTLLIAGGVGITPMRALFETIPVERYGDLVLVYRARRASDLIFVDEIDAISVARGAQVHYVVGDGPSLLDAGALLRLVPDVASRDVYLCGPPPMAAAMRRELQRLGHPRDLLHEERFAFA